MPSPKRNKKTTTLVALCVATSVVVSSAHVAVADEKDNNNEILVLGASEYGGGFQQRHRGAKFVEVDDFVDAAKQLKKLDGDDALREKIVIQLNDDNRVSKNSAKYIDSISDDREIVLLATKDSDADKSISKAKDSGYLKDVEVERSEEDSSKDDKSPRGSKSDSGRENNNGPASDDIDDVISDYWKKHDERDAKLKEYEKELDRRMEAIRNGTSSSGSSSSSGGGESPSDSDDSSDSGKSSDESSSDDKPSSDGEAGKKISMDSLDDLKDKLSKLAERSNGTTGYAVALAGNGEIGISAGDAGEKMYTASTIKVPIAMAVQKNLKSDESVTVSETAGGSSGGIGVGEHKVSDLLAAMIEDSDNTATNALITKLGGFDKVNAIIKDSNGGKDTKLDNMMMDQKNTSTTSANSMVKVLQTLWSASKGKSDVLDKDKAKIIIDHMYKQSNRNKLPSLIEDGKAVANKTGENTGISHDIGFITNEGRTVAVASINSFTGDAAEYDKMTGEAGKVIYDWLGNL